MPGIASRRRVSPWSATEAGAVGNAGVWIVIRAPEINRQHLCNAMWRLCNIRLAAAISEAAQAERDPL
jgi:hypothetical protein